MNLMNIDLNQGYGLARGMILAACGLCVFSVVFELLLIANSWYVGRKREAISMLSMFAIVVVMLLGLFALVPLIHSAGIAKKELPHSTPRHSNSEFRRQRGFGQLLAMLICCAVMMILMASAVPNVVDLIRAQNGQAALGQLRALADAEGNYEITYHNFYLYPSQLSATAAPNPVSCTKPMVLSGAVNVNFQIGTYRGYQFVFTAGPAAPPMTGCIQALQSWTATATPINGATGTRSYFIDQSGVLHVNDAGRVATVLDPILH